MSTMPSNMSELLTAEEFAKLPDDGSVMELVRGRVSRMPPPGYQHGRICGRVARLLGNFLEGRGLGECLTNDAGLITHRKPDSVRGADVSFYSFTRVSKDEDPKGYPSATPELIFEIRSPDDRWNQMLEKVTEYLKADVLIVCVLDPSTQNAHVFQPDPPVRVYGPDETIDFAPVLPGWRVTVRDFFNAS